MAATVLAPTGALHRAYIGNAYGGPGYMWRYKGTVTSRLSATKSDYYDPYTTPADGKLVKLDTDEYPSDISFSGAEIFDINESASSGITVYLCDPNASVLHQLISTDQTYFNMSAMNKTNRSWTDLAGKTLCLRKVGDGAGSGEGYCISARATIDIETKFIKKNVSISQRTGGTVVADKTSAVREDTVTLTVTPTDQYWRCTGMTASAGTVAKVNNTTWQLTMPSPAVDVTVTTTYTRDHALIPVNPGISFSQEEYRLTVTKSGSVTDTLGQAVSYRLMRGGVKIADFNGDVAVVTLTDTDLEQEYTYTIEAYNTISVVFATGSYTALSVHKTLGYYTGGRFVPCIVYVWLGTEWQEVWPYYWTGSRWVLCSQDPGGSA